MTHAVIILMYIILYWVSFSVCHVRACNTSISWAVVRNLTECSLGAKGLCITLQRSA